MTKVYIPAFYDGAYIISDCSREELGITDSHYEVNITTKNSAFITIQSPPSPHTIPPAYSYTFVFLFITIIIMLLILIFQKK
jgi:hypothetical protein